MCTGKVYVGLVFRIHAVHLFDRSQGILLEIFHDFLVVLYKFLDSPLEQAMTTSFPLNKLAQEVMLLAYVQEVLDLNLRLRLFLWFSSVFPGRCSDSALKQPHTFQLFIC
jgi:hypothetical protein